MALKVVNGELVLDNFHDTEREERDGVLVSIVNTLTLGPPRLTQRISIRGGPGHGEYHRRQRLYRVEELRAALEHAGLSVVDVLGNPDGEPFEPATSSTMWVVARRGGAV